MVTHYSNAMLMDRTQHALWKPVFCSRVYTSQHGAGESPGPLHVWTSLKQKLSYIEQLEWYHSAPRILHFHHIVCIP
jgi:hypothetical protein